jgi:hypothetical protein
MPVPMPITLLVLLAIVGLVIGTVVAVAALIVRSGTSRHADNPNLRPCPDCGHSVSVRATTCPQCGGPLKAEHQCAFMNGRH